MLEVRFLAVFVENVEKNKQKINTVYQVCVVDEK